MESKLLFKAAMNTMFLYWLQENQCQFHQWKTAVLKSVVEQFLANNNTVLKLFVGYNTAEHKAGNLLNGTVLAAEPLIILLLMKHI